MMNKIRTSKFVGCGSNAVALLTIVLVVTLSSASAKEHKIKASGMASQVVAHISFTGLSTVDMAMQEQVGDKRYLYVQHPRDEGISVVDVSEPAKPKVVQVIPWPDPAVSSHMNVTGNVALISENEVLPVHDATTKDDLVLWDLSNPVAPQVVKKFSGVVRFLQDNRNFIYVLNSDGLWVISTPDRQPEQVDTSLYGG
jgi:uncharacterized secreted protein with C-terminal beta-propeller domain